jgi:Ser/Thr protein kinase RdoA (MazF antagonist)
VLQFDLFNKHKFYLEEQVRKRYNIDGQLRQLRGSTYECEEKIFKIILNKKSSADYIAGIIDFIRYLICCGIATPNVVPSINNLDIEIVKIEDSYFSIVAYEKAKGNLPDIQDWDKNLFRNWGQLMGKIHFLTKEYKVPEQLKNMQWETREIHSFEKYIPSDQEKLLEKSYNLLDRIKNLPKDIDTYGFIHSDFHQKNFFVDKNKIIIFDFDDAINNWFISDISTSFFYAINWSSKSEENCKPRMFLDNFLNGYIRENQIKPTMLKYIPEFLMYERLRTYAHFYKYIELTKPDNARIYEFQLIQAMIENEIPVFNLDIDSLIS